MSAIYTCSENGGVQEPMCPHGDGNLAWVEDQYRCRKCGDEWSYETIHGVPLPGDCPFCDYSGPSKILCERGDVFFIEPISPVVPGHVLAIPRAHIEDARADVAVTGDVFEAAAWFLGPGDANLITSVGASATQTVRHLHVHIVPRALGDGLALPWNNPELEQVKTARFRTMDSLLHEAMDQKCVAEAELVAVRQENATLRKYAWHQGGCSALDSDWVQPCDCGYLVTLSKRDEAPRARYEFAWLIERGQAVNHAPTIWWKGDPEATDRQEERYETHWTQNAYDATWFANERVAQAVIDRLFWASSSEMPSALAVEHGFAAALTDGTAAPTQREAELLDALTLTVEALDKHPALRAERTPAGEGPCGCRGDEGRPVNALCFGRVMFVWLGRRNWRNLDVHSSRDCHRLAFTIGPFGFRWQW